jgi:hypothetical protein
LDVAVCATSCVAAPPPPSLSPLADAVCPLAVAFCLVVASPAPPSRNAWQVSSVDGSNSMAVLNRGFSTGLTRWEFRLDEDSRSGECTCFGAVTRPLTDFSYNSSAAYMYRCYNGQLYGKNSASGNKAKVRGVGALPVCGRGVGLVPFRNRRPAVFAPRRASSSSPPLPLFLMRTGCNPARVRRSGSLVGPAARC